MADLSDDEIFLRLVCAALSNPAICTGQLPDYTLIKWFRADATAIRTEMIIAKQAIVTAKQVMQYHQF